MEHHQAGRLQEADALYRQILASQPDHPGALQMLGVLAHQVGRNDLSADLFRRLISFEPQNAEAHNNLGVALAAEWKLAEAEDAYRRALALRPDFAQAHNNLAGVLRDQGKLDEAIVSYHRAIELSADYAEAHHNLGLALVQKGKLKEAIAAYQQALRLWPDWPDAIYDLGLAYHEAGNLDRASDCYRKALALRAEYFDALVGLARALKDSGEIEEAVERYREALQLQNDSRVHAALIFALHYLPDIDPGELLAEHRKWNELYAQPLAAEIRPHTNDRSPNRRLRVGYVSPDFSDHPVGRCLLPVLTHRDRAQFEIYCYSGVMKPDELTGKFKKQADVWREAHSLSHEDLARQIRDDRIDVLVDLAVHTAGSRLLTFARKPAPVQVTWLGWPGTTGMDAIDYRLSDPYLDPPASGDEFYSEKTMRLRDSFWCYEPSMGDVSVNSLPVRKNGYITFGCLGNFWKVNDSMIDIWARLLLQVPRSRLLIRAPLGGPRRRLIEKFNRRGIATDRIEVAERVPLQEYWELYHRIDITFDTTPYGGHTTAMDSLWMGVPVVSLIGRLPVGRAALSILSNLQLQDLAVPTSDQYVNVAANLAFNLPRLAELRSTLRQHLRDSALMDAPKFARNLEAAYRQMWHNWLSHAAVV